MSETTGRYVLETPIATTLRGADGQDRIETLSEVTLRPPVAGDLRVMDRESGEIAKALALLGRLTGLDARTIDKLDLKDFGKLSEMVEAFMPAGLRTGATS